MSDYARVVVSDQTKFQLKETLSSLIDNATSDDEDDGGHMNHMRARELDDRERRLNRRERELDEAQRMLQEKLGSEDIIKTINDLSSEKERQKVVLEDLQTEKQKLKQLGNKVSQEVKRAKAGFLREQKKIENLNRELENKKQAIEEAHKLMNEQIEQLERISSAGSMTVIQNLSNRILDLTRQVGESSTQQGALEHTAVQMKEQLNHAVQENQELQTRHNKLKQQRDQLHDQSRTLKKRINELELERIRSVDQEDKLLHQIEQWEQEHANSNSDLENLLHSLLDLYRDTRLPSQGGSTRRSVNPYPRNNLEPNRGGPTRSSVASMNQSERAMFDSIDVTRFNEIDHAINSLGGDADRLDAHA